MTNNIKNNKKRQILQKFTKKDKFCQEIMGKKHTRFRQKIANKWQISQKRSHTHKRKDH